MEEWRIQDRMSQLADVLEAPEEHGVGSVNGLVDMLQLDLGVMVRLDADARPLLSAMKKVLTAGEMSGLDYSGLLSLLDTVVKLAPFETVLEVFSVEDIITALESDDQLVRTSCKVLAVSHPKDLFSTTRIIDVLLQLYFSQRTVPVNAVEDVFQSLCTDGLIRRRILENNYPLLREMRSTHDAILFSRYLVLMTILFRHIDRSEFQKELFVPTTEEVLDSLKKDIFLFINVAKYYRALLEYATDPGAAGGPRDWALSYILPVLHAFGHIYENKEKYIEVHSYARAYLFQLLRTVSYLEDMEVFRELDVKYLHISGDNPDVMHFMAIFNPMYLYRHHFDLLTSQVTVKPSFLPVLKNIVSCQETFEILKPALTASAILIMPYSEQMVLLGQLSSYPHSTEYLVQELPKVMSNLICNENGPISEPETIELRKKVFENLLLYSATVLNVWYEPLLDEYTNICSGKTSFVRTEVVDMYL
ncbi:FAEL182Wp [Eremothecium gossypii FDAG1]|nr:FAEL182Wp [Eremothecium gossypii FDAG1]